MFPQSAFPMNENITTKQGLSSGLSSEKARIFLEKYGPNILPKKKSDPWWKKLLKEFSDLMVVILIFASLLSFFLGEKIDGSIILAIVFLNAGIGFFQEWKSEKTLEALQKMVSPEATVIRDGVEQKIEAKNLVPGDLIVIREGDRIPADGKVVEVGDLKVEESALTGEPYPVEKEKDAPVFLGTAVVFGSARVLITETGAKTKFGLIAHLTLNTRSAESPLQKEIADIGIFVGKIAVAIVAVIFLLDYFWKGSKVVESFLFSISVAVAAVPEGLPATITIALALGVQRLAKNKAVVKKLSSVETLGATTVICSDKTGTITRNEMTVREGYFSDGVSASWEGIGWNSIGHITMSGLPKSSHASSLSVVLEIGMHCNEAIISPAGDAGVFSIIGDPTEAAILIAAEKFRNQSPGFPREVAEPTKKYPFDSSRKMMSVLAGNGKDGNVLYSKGAPEMILPNATHFFDGEKEAVMTPEKRAEFLAHVSELSEKALRVLAFAKKNIGGDVPKTPKEAEHSLVFYGLLGMIDPPRAEVPEAVEAAHSAGVRIIIITGDNPKTAEAISREVGIIREDEPRIITGDEMRAMSDGELTMMLYETVNGPKKGAKKYRDILFARSAPEDKMRIVSLLQEKGEIVAVTGDGVNDAPALKKANIGVTMGIAGTEVSKEAASMILLDDSFATIVFAIREGRIIYENLKKFIFFLFSGNMSELMVILAVLCFSIPNPFTAVLILVVNLGTDALPAIALSFEKGEKEIMNIPPRAPDARILNKQFILRIFRTGLLLTASVLAVVLWSLMNSGWSYGEGISEFEYEKLRSLAFATLVLSQLFVAFSVRHFRHSALHGLTDNLFLFFSLGVSLAIVLAVIYIPLLQVVFKTSALTGKEMAMVVYLSSLTLWIEEIRKFLLSRKLMKVETT